MTSSTRSSSAPTPLTNSRSCATTFATKGTPQIATGYVGRIIAYCEGLAPFPRAGGSREEIRPGLRITSYQKRVTIADAVDDDAQEVSVIGVYYGGQDWESALTDPQE